MDRKNTIIVISTIIVGILFILSLWMIIYEPGPEPILETGLYGAPLGGANRPYETIGLMLSVFCFTIMVMISWVGLIHLKMERLKVLDEQRKKGLISEVDFKKKVEEVLSDY